MKEDQLAEERKKKRFYFAFMLIFSAFALSAYRLIVLPGLGGHDDVARRGMEFVSRGEIDGARHGLGHTNTVHRVDTV